MLNGLNSVGSIFIMIGIGYFLAKKGVLNEETNYLFSKIVIQIAIPLLMISSIPQRFTLDELIGSWKGLFVAFASMLLTYGIAYILALVLKIKKKERGVFCVFLSLCNSLFIGLPINISLYGEESAPYIFLFYIANTLIFWTLGVYNIKKHSSKNKDLGMVGNIKKVFSPPLIGFIIGILLIVLKLELPDFLNSSFNYIGQLSTPLSMFFIGTVIYNIDFKEMKINLTTVAALVGKFILSPLIIILLLSLFEIPELLGKVFIIQGVGPIITQIALVTEYYDVNSKYAAFMVGLSTIIYMFVLPIYVFLIG